MTNPISSSLTGIYFMRKIAKVVYTIIFIKISFLIVPGRYEVNMVGGLLYPVVFSIDLGIGGVVFLCH